MRALFLIGLILVTAPQAQSLAASDNNSWLPLSRSEIIQLTLGATNAETLKIETSDVQKANLTGFLPSDDTIWIVSNPAIPLTMVIAGRDQNVEFVACYRSRRQLFPAPVGSCFCEFGRAF